MSDGTEAGKTVAGETLAATDRQHVGGPDDAAKRDAVIGEPDYPWLAKYHILHKQNS